MNCRVYLAGPINGCTDDEAKNWREVVKERLGENLCLDPMRRDYRGREDRHIVEIVALDKGDIRASDAVLANCWQVSWGTGMEIHYARSIGKPVIAVVPPGVQVSPWLRYHATLCTSLDNALSVISALPPSPTRYMPRRYR
jgi:nucleoside 2-deoxyribosyltransferase